MRGKIIAIGVLVIALVLLLTPALACGKGGEETEPGITPTPGITPAAQATPTATPKLKTLRMGVLMPLSGPAALWGTSVLDGAKWVAEVVNEQGGFKVGQDIYTIEVIPADSQMMASVAIRECERLILDKKVNVIHGPLGTPEVIATMPICNQYKVWQYQDTIAVEPSPEYPYTIACSFSFAAWFDHWYDQLVKFHPEIKTVAITNMNVEDHPGGSGPMEQASAERHGLTVIANEYYDPATIDFYPLLTKIVAKNPDFLSIGITAPGHTLMIMKTARELGYKGVIGGANNVDLKLAEGTLPLQYLEGAVSCDYNFDSPLIPELARRNYEDFMRRVKTEMPFSNTHLYPWTDTLMFVAAAQRAGSLDPDAILRVMDDPNFTFETFWEENARLQGRETWGTPRLSPHWMAYTEIRGGKYEMKGLKPFLVP